MVHCGGLTPHRLESVYIKQYSLPSRYGSQRYSGIVDGKTLTGKSLANSATNASLGNIDCSSE